MANKKMATQMSETNLMAYRTYKTTKKNRKNENDLFRRHWVKDPQTSDEPSHGRGAAEDSEIFPSS